MTWVYCADADWQKDSLREWWEGGRRQEVRSWKQRDEEEDEMEAEKEEGFLYGAGVRGTCSV